MKNIGKKIKEIRKQNKLSQENLYPSNQSLVSQIEKGIIKNPNESTLRIFADNIGVSFDELVDGTDWDRNMTKVKKTVYAISQTDPIITIEKSGKINVKMKSYPRYNDSGDENKYCPKDGTELVTACAGCGRDIDSPDIKHCMGCGEFLIKKYDFMEEYVDHDFWCAINVNIQEQKSWYERNDYNRKDRRIVATMLSTKDTDEFFDSVILPQVENFGTYSIDNDEMLKLHRSDVPEVRDWSLFHIGMLPFFSPLAIALVPHPVIGDCAPPKKS